MVRVACSTQRIDFTALHVLCFVISNLGRTLVVIASINAGEDEKVKLHAVVVKR